jgi:polysaccharide export outer membrane protein
MFKRTNGFGLLFLLLLCTGCQLHSLSKQQQPVRLISQPVGVPSELCKASVPDYIIEPPDILTIEAIRILPRQPYLLQSLDSVTVQIVDASGLSLYEATSRIDPSGNLTLGPLFGSIEASGKTIEEVRDSIRLEVGKVYTKPQISADVAQLALFQQIAGEHLVGPDGRVNLGVYGQVRVAGLTLQEATQAVEEHLSGILNKPKIAIDVYGYNSKFYYVITEGAGLGDRVNRFPFTGNETVLDAVSSVEGFNAISSKQMWIARPGGYEQGGEQILPVDWLAISKRGDVKTNYQLLPGDRLFVAEDGLVAYDNQLAKKLAPIERISGVFLLVTTAAQRLVFFERSAVAGGGAGF